MPSQRILCPAASVQHCVPVDHWLGGPCSRRHPGPRCHVGRQLRQTVRLPSCQRSSGCACGGCMCDCVRLPVSCALWEPSPSMHCVCSCLCMRVHVCACVCMCVHVCACVCMCVTQGRRQWHRTRAGGFRVSGEGGRYGGASWAILMQHHFYLSPRVFVGVAVWT
jgi:hypothetical protein